MAINIDLQGLLTAPIYAYDFQVMIGDIQGSLDFSEKQIKRAYRVAVQSIEKYSYEDSPSGCREHLLTNAEHRFEVALPMRIRYGALIGLITSIEWSANILKEIYSEKIPNKPRNCNESVHVLKNLSNAAGVSQEAVKSLKALMHVRNAIVHAAGLKRDYRYMKELTCSVERLRGFTITNWHYIGEVIKIEKGALDWYISQLKEFVVDIHKSLDGKGLLK